jgi:hypothetical protein
LINSIPKRGEIDAPTTGKIAEEILIAMESKAANGIKML